MRFPAARRARGARRGLAAASAALLLASGTVALTQAAADAAAGCRVDYTVNDWGGGFTATVSVTNLGDPITGGWTLEWDFDGDQRVTSGWNGTFTQSGSHVTVRSPEWGGTLGTGATAEPGFQGAYSGSNPAPASFTLNGTVCTGSTGPTDPPPSTDPPGDRVDNPYAGAKVYVNPEWSANAAAEPGGSRHRQPAHRRLAGPHRRDRRAPNGRMGLRDHLDEALTQKGAGERRPARRLRPARTRLRRARLQRRARPDGDRQVQDRVHRPDRGDPRRPEVRRPADRHDRRDRLAAEPRHQRRHRGPPPPRTAT